MNDVIAAKLKLLPKTPGVYLMKDKEGTIIYVGKAIALKNRVSQYFNSAGQQLSKTRALVENIEDFDYVLCKSEMEALILETNMIKEYMPKYNILLKDDKHYPYVKIDFGQKYPTIDIVRKVSKDGCKYYGPFLNSSNLSKILDAVYEIYPIRTCKKDVGDKKESRPCLNYQIGRCLGPCAYEVDQQTYMNNVRRVAEFLNGKTDVVVSRLKLKMTKYSSDLEFEKAGEIRDILESISTIIQHQSASVSSLDNRDILGIAKGDNFAIVHLLIMRSGKVVGSYPFKMDLMSESTLADILYAFIMQYYDAQEKVPKEILLPFETESMEAIKGHLAQFASANIHVPVRGEKKQMVLMAMKNAAEDVLKQKKDRNWSSTKGAAMELAEMLHIDGDIYRMECYDISHTKGRDTVGSMVVFTEGKADKKEYRRFKIKDVDGIDDYASMQEIISRRLLRAIEEQSEGIDGKFSQLPDLIVVDGGKGQVSAAKEVLERLGFGALPLIGLAEKNEEIFLPGNSEPVILPRTSKVLKLLQAIRDEAHRFAITYHRGLRSKTAVMSQLDGIKGVGTVKKQELFKHFKQIEEIKQASIDELTAVNKMDRKTAKNIYEYFRKQDEKNG